MDLKTVHRILREEKDRFNLSSLRHKVKPYRGLLSIEGAPLLGTDDFFAVMVERGRIKLRCNLDKIAPLSDEEGRISIRHELCHVLDRLEDKIGNTFFGFKPDKEALPETQIMNAVIAETHHAYCELLMAKRYIRMFGLEEFERQNEIDMAEFLSLIKQAVALDEEYQNKLSAYHLYSAIFGTFKEVIKIRFYHASDRRFAPATWQVVEWICRDFEWLQTLEIQWSDKAACLGFIALAIFENFHLPSALSATLCREKEQFSWRAFNALYSNPTALVDELTDELAERWLARFNSL